MRKRKLLTALLAVAALMAIAIPASATDGAWTPGTDPRFDVYDSLTPNTARHDANDWNPNSMFKFHSGHYDIDNLCSLGIGWNWDGHSANDWMITAGHCLSEFGGDNETNIDGVGWTKLGHSCDEFASPAWSVCSTWPTNRNNWGYFADSGTDRTTMYLDSSFHADSTDYDPGLGTLWRGDISIFRVDKEAAARKSYVSDINTKWDIGAKFVPDPYTEYGDLCVYSPMLGAETCDWTVTGVDNMSLAVDSGNTFQGLTEITRSEDGTCAVVPGDSGALVYRKLSTTIRPVGIISGGQQNCSTSITDPPYSESQYFTSFNQIEAMWPGSVIN